MANQTYTVKSGDTIRRIALTFNVSSQSIAKASSLKNINKIHLGQKLTIPADKLENIVAIISNQSVNIGKSGTVNKQGFVTGMEVIKDQATNLEKGTLKEVNAIVLHRTESSSYRKPTGNYGTHFFVLKNGNIHQTASLNKKTWHIGKIKSKCMAENSCLTQDAKTLKLFGWNPSKVNKHEQVKPYTSRYPTNSDSVGIEVIGKYNENTKKWEPVTEKQKASVNKLVDFLEKEYALGKADRYNHEDISYKTKGEGSTIEKIVVD